MCAPRHITILSQQLHTFGKCYRSYNNTAFILQESISRNNEVNICEAFALTGVTSKSNNNYVYKVPFELYIRMYASMVCNLFIPLSVTSLH